MARKSYRRPVGEIDGQVMAYHVGAIFHAEDVVRLAVLAVKRARDVVKAAKKNATSVGLDVELMMEQARKLMMPPEQRAAEAEAAELHEALRETYAEALGDSLREIQLEDTPMEAFIRNAREKDERDRMERLARDERQARANAARDQQLDGIRDAITRAVLGEDPDAPDETDVVEGDEADDGTGELGDMPPPTGRGRLSEGDGEPLSP